MDFSFFLPSRGEHDALKLMLDSFERTTHKKDQIEILLLFDEGTAKDAPDFIQSQNYGFEIKWFYRPKSDWWTRDYLNFLADRTAGTNICAFNDDAWIKTVNWDDKIRRHIKESGWSIYFIDIPDSARIKYGHTFPCFPMIARKGMVVLGKFFDERVKIYPADRVLFEIYHHSGRIIKANDVYIQHDHILEWKDPKKTNLMKVFKEQTKAGELSNIDVTDEVIAILRWGQEDFKKKPSKLSRIINIIKEN